MSQETLVVIGTGMVAQQFCEVLARLGGMKSYRVRLFGEEAVSAYDRIYIHELLLGKSPDELILRPPVWYAAHGIELFLNCPVVAVDRAVRTVLTAAGESIRYDKLVLATGSVPKIPSVEGVALPGVFSYRSCRDVEAIREYVRRYGVTTATIVGGGVLGLEIATVFNGMGIAASLVEFSGQVLPQHLDQESATVLVQKMEALGMSVLLNTQVQSIRRTDSRLFLSLTSGDSIATQIVILAIGVAPRDELARACGLELGARGGIQINERLQTSDARIFAIGECVSFHNTLYGTLAPGYEMASILATNLVTILDPNQAQSEHAFSLAPAPFISKSDFAEIGVISYGTVFRDHQGLTKVAVRTRRAFRTLVLRAGRLVGACSIGEWSELRWLQDAIDQQQPVPWWRALRFRWLGQMVTSRVQHVSFLPKSAIVCHCMGITHGMLCEAFSEGHTSVKALSAATGASTVCGTCAPLVNEFLGTPALATIDTRTQKLFFSSFVACALILYLVFADRPPVFLPFADGTEFFFDARRSKEWTGYSALVLALLGLGVSLRKYWKRFTLGSLSFWRTLHACLGLTCVATIALHTGLRWGTNFNFVLLADFLGLTLIGTVLGMLMAAETRLVLLLPDFPVRKIRFKLTRLHRVVYSLFPVLLVFHILASYFY